ncbi:hypothetical protein G3A39_42450 [Paraburkholderia aspalathi]|nr:hypothetical protein [Paraburkholderia aspalathi]
MAGWKSTIQVRDLADEQKLEMTCRKCGRVTYIDRKLICAQPDREQLFLDEIEKKARCKALKCNGRMRMGMVRLDEMSGFVGGMP